MKRFYEFLVFLPITAGLMLLWPVDEVFTADATTTVSPAMASASSAIATASSAIATASSAIAIASSAIATASSAIASDPSATVVDAIACDNVTADPCGTAASAATASDDTSAIGDGDDCGTVASHLRLGHGADESPAPRADVDRDGTGRGLDVVGSGLRADGYGRPRTAGVKMIEKIILIAMSMFFEKLELAVYMSLYKLKVLYTTLILPML